MGCTFRSLPPAGRYERVKANLGSLGQKGEVQLEQTRKEMEHKESKMLGRRLGALNGMGQGAGWCAPPGAEGGSGEDGEWGKHAASAQLHPWLPPAVLSPWPAGTMSQYQELEKIVYNSLFTLVKDTAVLREYAAAALQIIQVGWAGWRAWPGAWG